MTAPSLTSAGGSAGCSVSAGSARGAAGAVSGVGAGVMGIGLTESIKLCGTSSSSSPRISTASPTSNVWPTSARMCFTKPSASDSTSRAAFVGLDLKDTVALFDLVADLDHIGDNYSFFHRLAKLRQSYLCCHL